MRFTSVVFRNTPEYARRFYTRIMVSSKFHDLQNNIHPNYLPLMQQADTDTQALPACILLFFSHAMANIVNITLYIIYIYTSTHIIISYEIRIVFHASL
jgi:hypothetical protein